MRRSCVRGIEQRTRIFILLLTDGRCCNLAAIIARGMQGKGAPARSYLQHTILGLQFQLPADAIQLLELGCFKRVLGGFVPGAGVNHALIEEEPEKLVAQVIVRMNIAAAALNRVRSEAVAEAVSEAAER